MQKQGMDVRALAEKPSLNAEYRWLYDAYLLLSRSRQMGGMGEFYIPMSEFAAYCELIGLQDTEQRLFLVFAVSQVDALLLHERYSETAKA